LVALLLGCGAATPGAVPTVDMRPVGAGAAPAIAEPVDASPGATAMTSTTRSYVECGGSSCSAHAPVCCIQLDDEAGTNRGCVARAQDCLEAGHYAFECRRPADCGDELTCCAFGEARRCMATCDDHELGYACAEASDCPGVKAPFEEQRECLLEMHFFLPPATGLCVTRREPPEVKAGKGGELVDEFAPQEAN